MDQQQAGQQHAIDDGIVVNQDFPPASRIVSKCVSGAADIVESPDSKVAYSTADDEEECVIPAPMATVATDTADEGNQVVAEIPPEDTKMKEEEGEEAYDDESEYEYEDDDDLAFSGFIVAPSHGVNTAMETSDAPARIIEEESTVVEEQPEAKKKWREPTRAAVNMSLRAQSETHGGKRRLAQDLYRIMNQDTQEAGFSLQPQSEDSMDKWKINLFQFDEDSNLAKDLKVLGIENVELEMSFPDQYPFHPPFVQVVSPRFKRQTGFVMNGALCMELLTKEGWNPINDIESVIVSVRSLLSVGDGRLQAAAALSDARYQQLLEGGGGKVRANDNDDGNTSPKKKPKLDDVSQSLLKKKAGSYSAAEAQSAYSHLSDYHKKKGWDTSGWWSKKG